MKKIINYIKESYNELVYKVSWPTRTELSNSAVVVMFASLIIAALIFVIDLGFEGVCVSSTRKSFNQFKVCLIFKRNFMFCVLLVARRIKSESILRLS